MSEAPQRLAQLLRIQAGWCERLGSPLYARILERAADDCAAGGPTLSVLEGHERDRIGSALSLRLMGAVHRLVLQGKVPKLAAHYPSAGGRVRGNAWPAFRDALSSHGDQIRRVLDRPVQTNEVGRSVALLGGFIAIAQTFQFPLRLFEVGASAGLNLLWDRYRYESSYGDWGDERSPVRFEDAFAGGVPPLGVEVKVANRMGCDEHPLDPRSENDRLTLMSYVWPDQTQRFERLRAALEIARIARAKVDKAGALEWLTKHLTSLERGVATVVYHTIVLQYFSTRDRRLFRELMGEAGSRATDAAPFAWLRFEPSSITTGGGQFVVRLTTWPGRVGRAIATAPPHGFPVSWLGDRRR